jgi:ABC-type glycerol-3-phosphate transport system substrate-binding protein
MEMIRTVFAMVVATLLMLAVSGASQALPIAPPAGAVSSDEAAVTPVYWYHHRYYRHHRHCWRGRWGHVHCGW